VPSHAADNTPPSHPHPPSTHAHVSAAHCTLELIECTGDDENGEPSRIVTCKVCAVRVHVRMRVASGIRACASGPVLRGTASSPCFSICW
jgi:hypothetical protein